MLLLIDVVGPRIGGAITVARNLLFHFCRLRPDWKFRVFILPEAMEALRMPVNSNMEFIAVPSARSGFGRVIWQQWKLPKLAIKNRADVIFSLVNIGARFTQVPSVVYYHQALHFFRENTGPEIFSKQYFREYFRKKFVLAGFRGATKIITQTEVMRKAIIRQTGMSSNRLICIPAGSPLKAPLDPKSRVEIEQVLREVRGLEHPVAVYLSHPALHKNFEALFRAAAIMKDQSIPGSFVLTLDIERPEDRGYCNLVESYKKEIKRLDVGDRVYFIGSIAASGTIDLLQSCDVLVFPSLVESFPQPLTEAMNAGLPLLLADRPYAREIGSNAALYFDPLDDGSSLADLIDMLASKKNKVAELRQDSFQRGTEFSYKEAAHQILDLFTQAAKRRG